MNLETRMQVKEARHKGSQIYHHIDRKYSEKADPQRQKADYRLPGEQGVESNHFKGTGPLGSEDNVLNGCSHGL